MLFFHRFFGQARELIAQRGQSQLFGILLDRGLLDRLGGAHWITSVAPPVRPQPFVVVQIRLRPVITAQHPDVHRFGRQAAAPGRGHVEQIADRSRFEQPSSNASSTARRTGAAPYSRPSSRTSIMARVPACLAFPLFQQSPRTVIAGGPASLCAALFQRRRTGQCSRLLLSASR